MAIFWLKRITNRLPVRVSVRSDDTKNPLLHQGQLITRPFGKGPETLQQTLQIQAGQTFWLEPNGWVAVDDFAIPWQPKDIRFGGDALTGPANAVYTNPKHTAEVSCAPAGNGDDHIHVTTPSQGTKHFRLGPTGPFHQMVGELVLGHKPETRLAVYPGTPGDDALFRGLNDFAFYLSGAIEASAKGDPISLKLP